MSDQPAIAPATGKARYRLKPYNVEAQQWFPGVEIPEVIWYQPPDAVIGGRGHGEQRFPQEPYWAAVDAGGATPVLSGDWIITDQDGHVYVVDKITFEIHYERIDNGDTSI